MYAIAELELKVKKDKIKELREIIEEVRNRMDLKVEFPEWYIEYIRLGNDRYIEYEDYYQKWYDIDKFLKWLLPYLENGSYVILDWEDGDLKKYEVIDNKLYRSEASLTFSDMNEV